MTPINLSLSQLQNYVCSLTHRDGAAISYGQAIIICSCYNNLSCSVQHKPSVITSPDFTLVLVLTMLWLLDLFAIVKSYFFILYVFFTYLIIYFTYLSFIFNTLFYFILFTFLFFIYFFKFLFIYFYTLPLRSLLASATAYSMCPSLLIMFSSYRLADYRMFGGKASINP